MKTKLHVLFCLLSLIVVVMSCADNTQTSSNNFNIINKRLNVLIDSLRNQNDSLYRSILIKMKKEETAQRAGLWFPKADYLEEKTMEINNYIMESMSKTYSYSAIINTDSFYKKITRYKNGILRFDADIYAHVNQHAHIITNVFDSVKRRKPTLFTTFLSNKTKNEQVIIMKRTLFNIKLIQNQILLFCNSKID